MKSMNRTDRSAWSWRWLAAAAFSLGAVLPGCNIVGPAFYLIHGPEKRPAAFTLDKKRSTVVFVDDQNSMLPRRNLRMVIASSATEVLQREKLVEDMIDGRGAIIAASRDRDSEPLSVTAIGRAVRAAVVIHVIMDSFTLSRDGQSYSPYAELRVKVIDAENDTRLWPPESLDRGAELKVTLFERANYAPQSQSAVAKGEEDLAKQIGQAVAELFYDHVANQPERKSR